MNASVKIEVTSQITLVLSEVEARALSAIFGYSAEAFLAAFYKNLGKAYVQPHEAGVRSLHNQMRSVIDPKLSLIDHARGKLNSP